MNLLLALCLMLAAPASQPTSQPVAPRADEQVIDDAKLKFRFAVPKAWKAVPQQAEATIYVFQLPTVGDGKRVIPSFIVTAREVEGDGLANEVDARRRAILSRNEGVRFDEDTAATIAGRDGWTFAYATKLNQTVTVQPGGQKRVEQVAIKVRDHVVVVNGRAFEFVLTSDDRGMAIRRRQAERAISTLAVE